RRPCTWRPRSALRAPAGWRRSRCSRTATIPFLRARGESRSPLDRGSARGSRRGTARGVEIEILQPMAFAPPARHLLRAKDLADGRYFEPPTVADLPRGA